MDNRKFKVDDIVEYKNNPYVILYVRKNFCWIDRLYTKEEDKKHSELREYVFKVNKKELKMAESRVWFLYNVLNYYTKSSPIYKINNIREYKAGYEVRSLIMDGRTWQCDNFPVKEARTPDGHYIGDSKTAYRLCNKMGIKPELKDKTSRTCSIGFCERENKWYGWSHRALYGFGIGSKVKEGDCAFKSSNKYEMLEDLKKWYSDFDRTLKIDCKDVDGRLGIMAIEKGWQTFYEYPDKWGKGEWVAETIEDARQMAIDFADGVS